MTAKKKTANYRIISDSGGNRYQFYCDVCGAAACTTRPYKADSPGLELRLAWESEGKKKFNLCHRCGKWCIDAMYNADVMECVDCTPYEGVPKYCKYCGTKIETAGNVCPVCGKICFMNGGAVHMTEQMKYRRLETYGFGPNVMKKIKICRSCHKLIQTRALFCSECGEKLPQENLYDWYRLRHSCCSGCGTVLTEDAQCCPTCGMKTRIKA